MRTQKPQLGGGEQQGYVHGHGASAALGYRFRGGWRVETQYNYFNSGNDKHHSVYKESKAKFSYAKAADEQRIGEKALAESVRLSFDGPRRAEIVADVRLIHNDAILLASVRGQKRLLKLQEEVLAVGAKYQELLKTSETSKVAAVKSKAEGDKLTKELEGEKVGGDIKVHALMFNAVYDFKNKSPITPYIGFGIGSAWVNSEGLDAFNSPEFAYQLMAGLSVGTFKGFELFAGYRYLSTGEFERQHEIKKQEVISQSFDIHIAELGLRYNF